METSLHRKLKRHYAGPEAEFEVRLGKYRIDVVSKEQLIEIQHGALAAIRDKIRDLLAEHDVLVVKPIIAQKTLVKLAAKGGKILQRRLSPKRGQVLDLFDEMVHFTRVFPHRRLTLEVPVVEIEEWRYPGHGRRRRWRNNDYQIEDQRLVAIRETHRFRTRADLLRLIPCKLPSPFHTGHLAEGLQVERWVAQRIAYTLRETGTAKKVGKQGNAWLYKLTRSPGRRKPAA